MKTIVILATTLLLAYVVAECPNGCSGQGTCSARDMCNCDKNYHGNDCSLRACPNAYAFIDTPKGDLNMDASTKSSWELTNSQLYPAGGYEFLYPDADTGEGHWYMECANRGLCDSETGTCVCFDGYEGAACQRTVCPNDCSGHGVCESISELSSKQNTQLHHKDTYHGTQTYTLWDKKTSYGCKCDPWFYGADCSKRRCKVGVDPMYEAVGQEIIETILLRVGFHEGDGSESVHANSYVRIKFWDYWGEAYHTTRITISDTDTITASNLQAALLALPNGVITDVSCATSATTTTVDNVRAGSATSLGTASWLGHIVGCKLTSNPGSLRLPTVDAYDLVLTKAPAAARSVTLTGSSKRGEDIDYCGTLDSVTVTSIAADATAVATSGTSDLGTIEANEAYLVKIKDQYVAVSAHAANSMTLLYAWNLPAITAATVSIFYSTSKMTQLTPTITTFTLGASSFTASADVSGLISAGTIIFTENQIFTAVSVSATVVTVDRPFSGQAVDGGSIASGTAKIAIWASAPTTGVFTYVSECSGRGLCESESGVCQCFKGYTNDNCDTQNILAF